MVGNVCGKGSQSFNNGKKRQACVDTDSADYMEHDKARSPVFFG
ncbi:MAG: hypothetical protein WCX86_06575 [Candidatus Hydrogenedentales bacterium]